MTIFPCVGAKFGRWTVESDVVLTKNHKRLWDVLCACGTRKFIVAADLRSGHSQSCGCLQRDMASRHGLRGHALYYVHKSMLSRCYDPSHSAYRWYGGRGVEVAGAWKDIKIFVRNVHAEIGERPSDAHQLDRIDNSKGYGPGNIRWSTSRQNCRNRKNILVIHEGVQMLLVEQAELLGIPYSTLYARLWRSKNGRTQK